MIWPVATLAYGPFWASGEGSVVSLAQYILDNFPDLEWMAAWAGGIPFQNAGAPLIPALAALLSALSGWEVARSYHAVVAVVWSLAPAMLFLLARRLGMVGWAAFGAGLCYSVLSPAAWLSPGIAEAAAWTVPRRLYASLAQDEMLRAASITVISVALIATLSAAGRWEWKRWFAAAILLALAPLTSYHALAMLPAALIALAAPQGWRTGIKIALLTAIAWALAAPWLAPTTLMTLWSNAGIVGRAYPFGWWKFFLLLLLIAIAVSAAAWLRSRELRALAFAAPLALVALAIWGAWTWWRFALLPQPAMWVTMLEWSICLLLAALAALFSGRLRPQWQAGAASVLLLLALLPAVRTRRALQDQLIPVQLEDRLEYRAASWLAQNKPEQRVLASGSTAIWLNAFSPSPQLDTGFEFGAINPMNRLALYTILTGKHLGYEDAPISVAWVEAMGVSAVVAGGPQSKAETFGFASGRKFDGILERAWSDGEDVIYTIPVRSHSLIYAILPEAVVTEPPENGLDVDLIGRYLEALQDPNLPDLRVQWFDTNHVLVTGLLRSDHLLSLRMSYHRGWNATVRGAPAAVAGDGLGQILIRPRCEGPCAVMIWYDGGVETGIAYGIRYTALGGFGVWALATWWRRRRARNR